MLRNPKRKRINFAKIAEAQKKKWNKQSFLFSLFRKTSAKEIPIFLNRNKKKVERGRKNAKEKKEKSKEVVPSRSFNVQDVLKRKTVEPKKTKSRYPCYC